MNSTGYARFGRRLPHSPRDCPVRLVPNPCHLVHAGRCQVQELLRRRGGTSGLGPRTHPRQRAGSLSRSKNLAAHSRPRQLGRDRNIIRGYLAGRRQAGVRALASL
jgi:hypothetical protein